MGENGAGKSTLIRIIAGAERADEGSLLIGGLTVDLRAMSPAAARALGISVIYQQPALFPDLTVAENIALALEGAGTWRPIDWASRRVRARKLLDRAGAAIDADRLAGTLSMPEQQLVEIAKAMGAEARIVLMDEPTAALTDREVQRLFAVIASLRQRGVGVLYISHRLEEVFTVADRVTVLRDGETIVTGRRDEITIAEVVRHMAGRELSSVFPKRSIALGDVILEGRNISSREAGLHNVSFSVRRGEILGLAGLVGSGRTELAEILFGLRRPDSGHIIVDGAPVTLSSPADAQRHGIACVPEDRRRHGVVVEMSIAANTSMAVLPSVSSHGLMDGPRERALATRYVKSLHIRTSSVDADVGTLSGGNQQKVALARWLAADPSVLILDEPTQGVDVGAKAEIHALMQSLVERGMAVLMISSELPEILGMSDRVAVMRGGTIAGLLSREQATPEAVLGLALEPGPVGAEAN